jgi:MoaA/NifB/PqqE/SkfB family radical SAM enzyme
LVSASTESGIDCGLITNGWFLSKHIAALAAAGLKRLLISIDSDSMAKHDLNRGLRGLNRRIEGGIAEARGYGIPAWACVTMNRLVDYDALPDALARLGFDAVVFSYPRREALGSSSLVNSEESALLDQQPEELLEALAAIKRMKRRFRVLDPVASLADVERFIRGEQQLFPCIAGHKYFYIDWNLDVWRCEPWSKPMGSVFDLDNIPDQREPCNACMMGCYRHATAMMHGAIAVTDAAQALVRGDVRSSLSALFQRGVAQSLWAVACEQWPRAALSSLTPRTRRRVGSKVARAPEGSQPGSSRETSRAR